MKSTLISLCLLPAATLTAQETLGLLPLTSQPASTPLQTQPENRPYSLRLGDFRLSLGASLQGEWNDNIGLTDTGTIHDFIIRPQLSLHALYPITEANSIDLVLGAGYEAYLQHSQYSRLLITPGSVLSFNATAGDFKINLHDRFSYVNDPSVYGNVSGVARIGGLYNTAGFDVSRDIESVTATVGYDHQNFIASSSQFSSLNDSADIGTARVAYNFAEKQMAGLEAGGGHTSYDQNLLSGYDTYSVGAFTDWQLTSIVTLIAKAGYVDHQYDTPALTEGHTSIPGYYLTLGARGDLNPKLSYDLVGGREETVSIDGGLLQQWYASLNGKCEIIPNGFITAGVRYEDARQPFQDSFENSVYFAPHYDRVMFQAGFAYPIAPKMAATITYNLLIKDASNSTASYTVNDIILGLTYNL